MTPAQLGALPGLGSGTLLIGAVVFAVVLVAVIGIVVWYTDPFGGEPWEAIYDAAAEAVDSEDADALALIPYSDGPLVPKPAIYDRELLGGKGGYRTPDGDRIYVDGEGSGKFSMGGVDVILSIDPTEHAAAADPLKAYIAHEMDIGAWIKVDREGNLIEAGEALKNLDGVTPAMDEPAPNGAAVADGGATSEVHRHAAENGMGLDEAKAQLEEAGELTKIVDLAPPREVVVDPETGEMEVEEATHVAVDTAAAADILPKKTNTTAWQVMEEKARQEGMDEEKLMEYAGYGLLAGAAIVAIAGTLLVLVMNLT